MPQILVDGELREVTQEEFDAWTAANPGAGERPAGGDVLQMPTQPEILIPNTTNTSPDQELNDLYEEFVTTPSAAIAADYYGEELTKNIENRDYFFPKTLEPVTTDDAFLARLEQEELERQPIVEELSRPVTSGLYTVEPLTKDIAERVVYDMPPEPGPTQYGSALTTEPVRNLKPNIGDTLSSGGSAALVAAAAIGTYAYKALFPPTVNDYSKLADYYKVDGLPPITPEHYGPNDAKNYDEYYNQDGLPPIEPENYDAISLDNPYEDQIGLENLTDDTISYNDLVDQDADPTAVQNTNIPGGGFYGEPPPISPNYTAVYNPESGTYDVIDIDTGQIADTGLDQESAELAAETANTIGDPSYGSEPDPGIAESDVVTEPFVDNVTSTSQEVTISDAELFGPESTTVVDGVTSTSQEVTISDAELFGPDSTTGLDDPYQDQTGLTEFTADDQVEWTEEDAAGLDSPYEDQGDGALDLDTGEINYGDELSLDTPYQDTEGALDLETGEYVTDTTVSDDDPLARYGEGADDARVGYEDQATAAAAAQQAAKANAQAQAELQRQRNQASQGDWRVRLRLAPGSDYLYKAGGSVDATRDAGILGPLVNTDGVIFPYMPVISTVYHATYNPYDLTHSNYRGYFYQNSYVGEITITAPFTAQDTNEAEYLLAVIHFFRSATKMFYGQDTDHRGSPPPLVFLQGLGQYQFNLHPCVISQFTYNLPNDVDYIRARSKNADGTNMLARRNLKSTPSDPFSSAYARLASIGQKKGAENPPPAPPTLGQQSPTYVPTKMEIQLTLLPIQSRAQVSRQFNMTGFANGDLLEGGFW